MVASKHVGIFYFSKKRFSSSCWLSFNFPFGGSPSTQQSLFPGASSQTSSPFGSTGESLAPSPFQKKNVLSASPFTKSQFASKKFTESPSSCVFAENPATEDFQVNQSDFSAELLAETFRKHRTKYEKVVIAKVPSTKDLFESLSKSNGDADSEDLQKKIQEFIIEFSIPPASHPHSSKFGTSDSGAASASSYFKDGAQPSVSDLIAQSFNNVSAKAYVSKSPSVKESQGTSASPTFSPFARPNFNPPGKTSVKPKRETKAEATSPFQPPNTSVPEYYSKYLSPSVSEPNVPSNKPNETHEDPLSFLRSSSRQAESTTFSPMGSNMQADARQQDCFAPAASFIGTSQTFGTSIRNLAATSLASTYSGSVESVSEGGERSSANADAVFVTNANIDFNPYNSGTVIRCKERIAEIDNAVLNSPDHAKNSLQHRSLASPDNVSIDVKQLRLLGNASEQNKVKALVLSEDDAGSAATGRTLSSCQYATERQICKKCGKTFANVNSLYRHDKEKHGSAKTDFFVSLQNNFGSLRQLCESQPHALQEFDISDWYDFNREEHDVFYRQITQRRPFTESPESIAGYVARRQEVLSENVGKEGIDWCTPPDKLVNAEVAVSTHLVNQITLSGSLEYAGEKSVNGVRFIQMYITVQCEDSERIPVRYILRSAPRPVLYPTKKRKNKAALFASLKSSTEKPFSVQNVTPDDSHFVSSLQQACDESMCVPNCIVMGELRKDSIIDGSISTISQYAYVVMNASKGKLVFL